MLVVCSRCRARYEFAASAIPADGYMAQCSHCDAQFFVAPPAAEANHQRPPSPASAVAPTPLDAAPSSAPASSPASEPARTSAFAPAPQPAPASATATATARAPAARPAEDQALPSAGDMAQILAEEALAAERAQARQAGGRRPRLADLFGQDLHDARGDGEAEKEAAGSDQGDSAGAGVGASAEPQTEALKDRARAATGEVHTADDAAASYFGPRPTRPGRREGGRTRQPGAHRASSRSWIGLTSRGNRQTTPPTGARSGLVVGMICTALVALGVVVGVVRSKRLHLPTQVPPPLRIVRVPPAAAQEAFAKGLAALSTDTAAGMEGARRAFSAARSLDEDYTDAWAGEALAELSLAELAATELAQVEADLVALDRTLQALAEAQGSRARVMPALGGADGNAGLGDGGRDGEGDDGAEVDGAGSGQQAMEAASAALQLRAALGQQRALRARRVALDGQLHAYQTRAASTLLHAGQLLAQTPLLATTMAYWYVGDPTVRDLVLPQLKVAEQLGMQQLSEQPRRSWGEDEAPPPVASPYAGWRMLVRARLAAARQAAQADGAQAGQASAARAEQSTGAESTPTPVQTSATDAVVAAYEAALRLAPDLLRARWELAGYLLAHGRATEAAPHVQQLARSGHDRAQVLWQQWAERERKARR